MPTLSELAAHLPEARLLGADVPVRGIAWDSRLVTPGDLFVAVPGLRHDGHDFLQDAMSRGAVALAVQADRRERWSPLLDGGKATLLEVPDSRRALSRLAAAFHGFPARRLTVIGVTGTDGKSSLVHLLSHVLGRAGGRAGFLGTIGWGTDGRVEGGGDGRTTPEAPQVQAALARMVASGCRYAVVECTSHGLALYRVEDCEPDVGVITNLGRDHLDFHGSFEAYREAKGRLFRLLDSSADKGVPKAAVLNADDPSCDYFRSLTAARSISYGLRTPADVVAHDLRPEGWGTRFRLEVSGQQRDVHVSRPGDFNVANALAAVAVGLALGLTLDSLVEAVMSWPGAPGRLETIDEGQPFLVVVDYAHGPDSLRRVLELLRARARGRVIALFGCIGGRERERRFPMGQVAGQLADYVVLTDDNPYDEDRLDILREVAAGLEAVGRRQGHDYVIVPDRREAIAHALAMASDDDAVLLAGRGHETIVYLADGPYECDDREVARQALRSLYGLP
ncbi:MAG: UDP-N-acetylmuramoyl-L-alanyl-D-glutamate--2,6-diaminopimelate ligase [Dehalococcoidia bacterium]|jgi:UDP-N-acetylmuramyl-tripeptide synthetase|nr:UDP-N-acetylmuramoyl-L-alanyl-D-glutamate--2,6-diaminopimelate ligase [Dehalococcoidia bacterium]MDW8009966.1 UDP-N-acetylmuramoyl-L-alanyl-D-glutamate--2,6-diaminopimelate ligase [Chloroflexota bacterium]